MIIGAGAAAGPLSFSVETLSRDRALHTARSLAPLDEAGVRSAGVGRNASLLEVLGLERPETIPVEELWYGSR